MRIPKRGLVKKIRLFSKKFLYLWHKSETTCEFKHGKTFADSTHPNVGHPVQDEYGKDTLMVEDIDHPHWKLTRQNI